MTYADPRDAIFDVSQVRSELGSRTGRSARAVLVTAAIKILVGLGSTALLARLVPPSEQGLVALAMPVILIATGLSEFGLAQAVVQSPNVTHRLVSSLFWINVLLGGTLGTAVALLGWPAAQFYNTPGVTAVFFGFAPYVLFTVLGTQYVAILRRQLRIGQIEIGSLGSTLAASTLAVIAAMNGAGYWALIIQLLLAEVFNTVYLAMRVRWWPSAPWNADFLEARSALRFGGYLAAERLVGEFARNMQIIIIGRAFSSTDAGLFFRANTLAQMPGRRILGPLSGAFLPALSRLQAEPAAFRDMYVRQVSRANLISIPIGLFMIVCSDVIVWILLGSDWLDMIPLLAWLGMAPATALILRSFSWVMVACGRGRELFLFRLVSAAILLVAMVIGAQIGLVGIVASYMIALVFVQGSLLAIVAVCYTPLTYETLRRAFLKDGILAIAVCTLMASLRFVLNTSALYEAFAASVALMICYILRIIADPAMRADVRKLLRRKM